MSRRRNFYFDFYSFFRYCVNLLQAANRILKCFTSEGKININLKVDSYMAYLSAGVESENENTESENTIAIAAKEE